MAAARAKQPSRNALEKGIIHEIPLSNYAKSLDSIVKKRYIDKISCIGVDSSSYSGRKVEYGMSSSC